MAWAPTPVTLLFRYSSGSMTFRFIHTADWQLGKPFGRFSPELAAQLRAARIDAIGTIAAAARAQGAAHVVVAGDVWDCETPSDETLAKPLDAMAQAADVTWWLLPGNHDPAARHGLWDRLRAGTLPANIRCLCSAEPVEAAPGVVFLPAPWESKNPGRDLTEDYARKATPEGALRIGIAHGGTVEFSQDAVQSSAIAKGAAARGGLDYLALGDWHGHKRVDERSWYAGTPEPDRFPQNAPGYVLSVEVAPGAVPVVEPLRTARYCWSADRLELLAEGDPVTRFEALHDQSFERRYRLAKVEVTGAVRLEDRAALLDHIGRESHRYAHLETEHSRLDTLIEAAGLEAMGAEGSLRQTAEDLHALSEDAAADPSRRDEAKLALDLLMTFAA
ncbi:metallophosphoesterase family protein [Parvularcula oceani]|uniref:metallophosphoesterase family protein n=1 Tax=Parvularcula oceani TaxID=1247963 RepID=UPI00138DE090|nr:metallophosphoesterase [Parvularcula oceani]